MTTNSPPWQVPEFSEGDRIRLGHGDTMTTGTVRNVVVDDRLGRSYIEYECDDGCAVETVGNLHRLHESAIRRFLDSGFLKRIEAADE